MYSGQSCYIIVITEESKMNYEIKNNDIILEQPDFDLDETLDCGQAFRSISPEAVLPEASTRYFARNPERRYPSDSTVSATISAAVGK